MFKKKDMDENEHNEIGLLKTLYTDSDYDVISKLKVNNYVIKKQITLLIFYKKIE